MEQIIGALKNEKISSSVLVMIVLGAWYAYGWAGDTFVKKGDFDELKTIMTDFVEDTQIVNASQLIRDRELTLQVAKAVGESGTQLTKHKNNVAAATAYRDCLIKEEPNCKHLKPSE